MTLTKQVRILGLTWEAWTRTHPTDDPDVLREYATAYTYPDDMIGPHIGWSYRDIALVLDYQSDDHDWEHDDSHALWEEIIYQWAQ